MLKTKTLACLALLCVSTLLGGCRTNAQTGSLIGAGLGTLIGSAVGVHNGNRGAGMLIGGAVGALGGYAIGNEVDKEQRGYRYEGDPRYEPGYPADGGYRVYEQAPPPRVRYVREYYPRERVIYRERYIYEGDGCRSWR
jgi:hypothetical protein